MAEMISPKERMKREQVSMPEQNPKERACNFKEVPLGYTREQAIYEAQRCLQCKNAKCIKGCPAEINIPQFIKKIVEEDFSAAYNEILKTDALPAITGRVCPQEEQCQVFCVLEKQGKPIAIGRLERFVADWARNNDIHGKISTIERKAKSIGIVGSGPAGLTCAADLAKLGYEVTIFEALHLLGGV
ncbi:MAG: NAD(P)-binding protein, partial [Candidatus Caldatribacteriota bacterium]|nr:NAD(P)-binding protein [Candidatus Caldatribacteriota bacterium]